MDIKEDSYGLFTASKISILRTVTVLKHGGITVRQTIVSIHFVTWYTDHVTCFITHLILTRFTIIIYLNTIKPAIEVGMMHKLGVLNKFGLIVEREW